MCCHYRKKIKSVGTLVSESGDEFTHTKQDSEENILAGTYTKIPGIDLDAQQLAIDLDKLKIKEDRDGFYEVQINESDNLPESDNLKEYNATHVSLSPPEEYEFDLENLPPVSQPSIKEMSYSNVSNINSAGSQESTDEPIGVFGLDESVVRPMTVREVPSPREESLSGKSQKLREVNFRQSKSINLNEIPSLDEAHHEEAPLDLMISAEEQNNKIEDDATIPLGGDREEFGSEYDATLPPDPKTYKGHHSTQNNSAIDMTVPPQGYRGSADFKISEEFAQAEHLRIAQQRIFQLEKENDQLRSENDELASAADVIKTRVEEYTAKISTLERDMTEERESFQSEIFILKGNLQHKENENMKFRMKIEDLEARLRTDFRKIRVRERELENRLELLKAEKQALVRAKDENILELRRKIDVLQTEIESYRAKLLELNNIIDTNQDQFKRTVKALRLALSSLEIKDENVVPLKKAE